MWKDQIVDDLHAIREAHAAEFGFDSKKIYQDIKTHEELSRAQGLRLVNFPPRRPVGWVDPKDTAKH